MSYFYYIIIIISFRMITISLTVLPKYNKCEVKDTHLLGGCYDKIFSGHTSTFFLAMLMYIEYGYIPPIIGYIFSILFGLVMIASRGHYTIDVLLAFFITFFVKTTIYNPFL